MKFQGPFVEASFVKRLNRFAVLVHINRRRVKAFFPNPSRLEELLLPEARLILAERPGDRATKHDVVAVYAGRRPVSIDARVPNRLFRETIEKGALEAFRGYRVAAAEPRYGRTRLDFLLERPGDRALVEVKSCSLVVDGVALFPDVPTERGRRHLLTLVDALKKGYRAHMVWVVQRGDARYLRPYREVDPKFEEALKAAASRGVQLHAYRAQFRDYEMNIEGEIPIRLNGGEALPPQALGALELLQKPLGLQSDVARAYTALVASGGLPREELAHRLGTSMGRYSMVAAEMNRLGLVLEDPSRPSGLLPVHPRMAVTNIVKMRGLKPGEVRAQVDRAVALLSALYEKRLEERRGG